MEKEDEETRGFEYNDGLGSRRIKKYIKLTLFNQRKLTYHLFTFQNIYIIISKCQEHS